MENMDNKYIDLLLNRCLNFDKSKSLFIDYYKENKEFASKIVLKAKEMGIYDIYLNEIDNSKTIEVLNSISLEEIDTHSYFNDEIWDVYAEKNASFLMIDSEFPGVMDSIDSRKIARSRYVKRKTKPIYKEKQLNNEIPWCICAYPNELWAKSIFGDSDDAYDKLYNVIMDMCMINTENPSLEWDKFLNRNSDLADKLNNLKISELHYKNGLGTDLYIRMPRNALWVSAAEGDAIVNMPSYEIFSSPDYRYTNGTVYSSKPLSYNGKIVDNFYLKFKDGKVIDFGAEKGYEILKEIIDGNERSSCLGEVALINYDSPISNTHLVFGTTLFDENASCHLALGAGFKECIENGYDMSDEDLLNNGINICNNHVDFMIGTSDLEIEAFTQNGNIKIFENGNFVI